MSASPPHLAEGRGPTGFERVLLGLLGIAIAAVALWFSWFVAFMLFMSVDCNGPHRGVAILEISIAWALGVAAASLPWLLALSLLRVAARRRWLRWRAWIAAPLVVAVVAVPFAVQEAAQTPPPTATCQPFSLH